MRAVKDDYRSNLKKKIKRNSKFKLISDYSTQVPCMLFGINETSQIQFYYGV